LEEQRAISASRLLIPSLPDLFFVFFLFWAFLASPQGWQGLLRDADTGFHIRAGDWILHSGTIPTRLRGRMRPGTPLNGSRKYYSAC